MENVTISEKALSIRENVERESFAQKSSARTFEQEVNRFLDSINLLRGQFIETCDKLDSITEGLQALTWCDQEPSERDLKDLSILIGACRGLHYTLIRKYATANTTLRRHGVCKKELNRYKSCIDGLKEDTDTVEMVFFHIPQDKEIQELISKLASIE